jgi:hypothetical protein
MGPDHGGHFEIIFLNRKRVVRHIKRIGNVTRKKHGVDGFNIILFFHESFANFPSTK